MIWGWDELHNVLLSIFGHMYLFGLELSQKGPFYHVSFSVEWIFKLFGVIMRIQIIFYPLFFFRHPSLQGSQGSSTSLSSTKVSSSVEDGDGLVTEGEENSCDRNVPSVRQWAKAMYLQKSHVWITFMTFDASLLSLFFWFVHHVLITSFSHTFPLLWCLCSPVSPHKTL